MSTVGLTCPELNAEIVRLKARLKVLQQELKRNNPPEVLDGIWMEIDAVEAELGNDEGQLILQGCVAPRYATLRWEPVSSFAIQRSPSPADDPSVGPYHAGHVNDVLAFPAGSRFAGSVLIGADTGGVWLNTPSGGGLVAGTFPMSDDWDDPDVVCLAQGPDQDAHVYAGCSTTLYEMVDTPANPGTYSWRDLAPGVGGIFRIGVLGGSRRIVLATTTGIYWSPIPVNGGAYSWASAQWPGLDPILQGGPYSGLAVGPAESVAVAAFGDGANFAGLFFGSWSQAASGPALIMSRAAITGANPTDLFRTSLASGASDRSVMYAVASRQGSNWMFGVLKSTDGGRQWSRLATRATALNTSPPFPVGTPLESGPPPATDVAGGQGDYNNCIAVSPVNSEIVAIGWRNGPWVSTDGGSDWVRAHSDSDSRQVHSDLHAVYFDPNDARGATLYVGSDGGILVSPDRGLTYDDSLNRRLLNLQFQSQPAREFYGRFTASAATPGLIGGGLQDNGNVYCLAQTNLSPWRQLDESDGQMMAFLPAPSASHNLLRYNSQGGGVSSAVFDLTKFTELGVIPVTVGKPGVQYPGGLQGGPIVEVVRAPAFRQAPLDLMWAVAGINLDVYGLFAGTDGARIHWEYLGTVPLSPNDAIWSIASGDGNTVLAGTQFGRLFAMDPRDGSSVEQVVPLRSTESGSITRIVVGESQSYAAFNTGGGGSILRANGPRWEALSGGLPDEAFFAIEVPFNELIFAATDRQVFVSDNSGDTWFGASDNLPRRPHCSDLRYVQQEDGQEFLYLSTYGRSAYRIQM